MSNEFDIQAQFDRLMNQYGYDEAGKPTPLLMRAFHEGTLNRAQLGRLQQYFAGLPPELSMVGGEDDDTPLPPEYEEAAEEILRRVLGEPVPALALPEDWDDRAISLLACLSDPEQERITRSRELAVTRRAESPAIEEFDVDLQAARQIIASRMAIKGDQIRALPAAINLYADSVRLTPEELKTLDQTISAGISLFNALVSAEGDRLTIRVPSDQEMLAGRVGDLVEEHRERYLHARDESAEAKEQWRAMAPSIKSQLVQPWMALINTLFEALRAKGGA